MSNVDVVRLAKEIKLDEPLVVALGSPPLPSSTDSSPSNSPVPSETDKFQQESTLIHQIQNKKLRRELFQQFIKGQNLTALIELQDKTNDQYWPRILADEGLPACPPLHPTDQLLAHFTYVNAQKLASTGNALLSDEKLTQVSNAAIAGSFLALRRLEKHYLYALYKKQTMDIKQLKQIALLFEQQASYHGSPGYVLAGTVHLFIATYFSTLYDELRKLRKSSTFVFIEGMDDLDIYDFNRIEHYFATYKYLLLAVQHEVASRDQIECYYRDTKFKSCDEKDFFKNAFNQGLATSMQFCLEDGTVLTATRLSDLTTYIRHNQVAKIVGSKHQKMADELLATVLKLEHLHSPPTQTSIPTTRFA